MKQKIKPKRNHAKLLTAVSVSLGLSSLNAMAQTPEPVGVSSNKVDTELLLLVDISGSIDDAEYGLMMGGYADAFSSSGIVESIQSGPIGAVAVSLMFWSGSTEQSVGVGWTRIDDLDSSKSFAQQIANLERPFKGTTAIGSALDAGTISFGTETGNKDNGFYSNTQIIDISGDGEDNDTPPAGDRALNVRNARDASIAAGVDMINALPIGNGGGNLEEYYQKNVIAGSAGGTVAFTQATESFKDVSKSLEAKVTKEIAAGAENVPEPSSTLLVGMSGVMCLLRRKR